jgi:3-carboxy-cis,cis-muconate cycloisomerase
MVQEEERGLGGWHAEWETMPELIGLTGGALHHLTDTIEGLEVDPSKMLENLNLTHGLIFAEAVQMALAKSIGRMAAHDRVEAASTKSLAEQRELRAVLSEDAEVTKHLKPADLDRLFSPREYIGKAHEFVDRVLLAHSNRRMSAADESE